MVTKPMQTPMFGASRDAMLVWIRSHAPDLRIARFVKPDGQRACAARFTYRGEVFEYESDTAPPEDEIVRACFAALRHAMGLPNPSDVVRRRELEKQIVEATRTGNAQLVASLTQELVTQNEARPRDKWRAETRIGDRKREERREGPSPVVDLRTT